MSDYPNDIILEHAKDIATLRADVDNIKEKVDDFSIMKDTLVELKALSKEQSNYNKKFNEMYEKSIVSNAEFSNTLININANLNSLNSEIKGVNERIDDVEIKIENIDDKSKIDIMKMVKDWTPKLILGGAIYYILQLTEVLK